MDENYKYCTKLVRQYDKNRYLSGSLADSKRRQQLFSLYAFDIEINQIRDKISDAFPGEVRIQWWRDAITGNETGGVGNHPIASALISTIENYQLPIDPICNLLEARTFDIYNDPMPTMHDLEGYLGETSSILFQLATHILTSNSFQKLADACGHAGVAYGLTNLLRSFPLHCRRRQLYIPVEIIKKYEVTESDLYNFSNLEGVTNILTEMRNQVRLHIKQLERYLPDIPLPAYPVFLPICLIELYLEKMENKQYQPFNSKIELSLYQRMKKIWSSAKSAKSMSLNKSL